MPGDWKTPPLRLTKISAGRVCRAKSAPSIITLVDGSEGVDVQLRVRLRLRFRCKQHNPTSLQIVYYFKTCIKNLKITLETSSVPGREGVEMDSSWQGEPSHSAAAKPASVAERMDLCVTKMFFHDKMKIWMGREATTDYWLTSLVSKNLLLQIFENMKLQNIFSKTQYPFAT